MGDASIDNIPYSDAVKFVKDVSVQSNQSNSPNVSLPSGVSLSPADPYSTDKTYEVVKNIYYKNGKLPADSDLTVAASRG